VPAAPPLEDEFAAQKAQAELSLAPALLRLVPVQGRLVTGDALSCQRTLCAQIRQAQGHYLFAIKRESARVDDGGGAALRPATTR